MVLLDGGRVADEMLDELQKDSREDLHVRPLSREDLQKELQIFAETVLDTQLAVLADRVNTFVRDELQARPVATPSNGMIKQQSPMVSRRFTVGEVFDEVGESLLDSSAATPQHNDLRKAKRPVRELAYKRMVTINDLQSMEDVMDDMIKVPTMRLNGNDILDGLSAQKIKESGCKAKLGRLVKGERFDDIVTVVILINAIYVGVVTDYSARNETEEKPLVYRAFELFFLLFFALEIGLRMYVHGLNLYKCKLPPNNLPNKMLYWNLLDTVVVALQVFEFMILLAGFSQKVLGKVSIVRLLRTVRLIRVVRLLKVFRFVRDLRMIVYSITRSFSIFLWSAAALFMLTFLWSIYFTELVSTAKLSYDIEDDILDLHFKTLPRTFLSLMKAVSGGIDWGELADALGLIGALPGTSMLVLYITFTTLAVMNVITGVFLDTAMEGAKEERERYVFRNARVIFEAADNNGNGMISWQDFADALQHPRVCEFFESIDIDPDQAQNLFDLLDVSGDGSISSDEFLNGCLRLRGSAKALDLLVLSREVQQLFTDAAEIQRANWSNIEGSPEGTPSHDVPQKGDQKTEVHLSPDKYGGRMSHSGEKRRGTSHEAPKPLDAASPKELVRQNLPGELNVSDVSYVSA